MKDLKWLVISFAIPAFSLIYAPISFAELRLTPSITLREEYNDNIFLTPSNEEDDYITSIHPAVNMTYNIRLLTLSMDYGLNFRFYADHTERNETSLSKTQRARLETTVSPYKDIFFIKVSDEYKRVSIDERRQITLENAFVNMTDSNNFFINPYIEYPLSGTLKARTGYRYTNIWYKEKEGNDVENHTGTVDLEKGLSAKITTSLSYSYLFYRPKKTEDYDKQDVTLGITYQINPDLFLAGNIGETWFDYERRNDQNFTIENLQANYLLTSMITLGAGYSESFFDSVISGTYKSKSETGTINYNGRIPLNLTAFHTVKTYTTVDRVDRSSGVTLDSNIPFTITPNISGGVTGGYSKNKFFPEGEDMKRYRVRLSINYDLKVTTASLGYTFNWTDSDVNSRDFKNNVLWVQARFTI